jgi:8-oxo-dGTP pyrophosphatase MutT (NUDIX family)
VRRTPEARFMGGVWVFPGGAVDVREGQGDDAHRAAGVRELREEAGITLQDPQALVKFSRWITPAQVKIRFDTHFFLAVLPDGQQARVDGEECIDAGWFAPAAALAFACTDELIFHARGREVTPVEPKVVLEGEVARVLLPGEPGY